MDNNTENRSNNNNDALHAFFDNLCELLVKHNMIVL